MAKRDEELAKKKRSLQQRNTYNPAAQSSKDQKDRTIPKHLQRVESRIKNRVQIDKEISKVRKDRGYYRASSKDPEIYVASPPPAFFQKTSNVRQSTSSVNTSQNTQYNRQGSNPP